EPAHAADGRRDRGRTGRRVALARDGPRPGGHDQRAGHQRAGTGSAGAAGAGATGGARLGDERKDHDDAVPRGRRRSDRRAGGEQRHRPHPHGGHRADPGEGRLPRPRRARGRRARPAAGGRPARRRAGRARQPQPGPAGPLRRSPRRRRHVATHRRHASGPARRRQRVRPPRGLGGGAGWRNDAAPCPNCAALLQWSADRFDCPSCGFGQPATPNRLEGDTLVLDGTRVPLRLALPGRWNLANAALAVTAATTHYGVDPGDAADAAATLPTRARRDLTVSLPGGRRARVLLAKNPAGWSEVLHYLSERDGTVVIAVNARVADGKDPSWLWDVPYELLQGQRVAAVGERALDVSVRLKYADVDHIVARDPLEAAAKLPGGEVD